MTNAENGPGSIAGQMDITRQKQSECERQILLDILNIVSTRNNTHELLRDVTRQLQEWSGCEAVGIRLREGEDFPYFETLGFPPEFVHAENRLCAMDRQGDMIRDSRGNPVIECMCGNILCERFNPSLPFFTKGGSFWTNSTSELLASTSEADRQVRTRNRCHGERYESVALIPLRAMGETFGLLQFNDKRKGMFDRNRIALFERVAANLTIGLAQRKTAADLRQSEARFRAIFEEAPIGVAIVNATGHILECNAVLAAMLGYTREELRQRRVPDITYPEDRAVDHDLYREVLDGKRSSYQAEKRYVRKDGSVLWGKLTGSIVRNAAGQIEFCIGTLLDISAQKKAEAELRRGEEMLAASQRIAHLGSWDHDHVHDVLRWSAETFRIYGVDEGSFVPTLAAFLGMVHPDDRQRVQEAIRQSKSQKAPYSVEHRVCRPDGTERVVHAEGQFFFDDTDRAVRAVGMVFDVTARRIAERARKESEQYFRSLIESAPDAIFVQSEGRFVYLNPPMLKLLGAADSKDLLGRDYMQYVAPEFLGVIRERIRFQRETGKPAPPMEMEYVRADGTRVPVEVTAVATHYQGCDAHLVFVRDITERKRAQDILLRSEANLAAAQRIAHIGSWEWNVRTNTAIWSDETYRIFGVARAELDQHRTNFLDMIHPDDRLRVDQALADALAGKRPYDLDYRICHPDGAERVIHARAEITTGDDGRPLLLQGTVHDITERKRAEDALRDSEARFQVLGEGTFEGVVITEGGRYTDVNEQMARMLGYEPAELIGMEIAATLHPEAREQVLSKIRSGQDSYVEHDMIRKDGSTVAVEARGRNITYQGRSARITAIHDISERKQAAAALHRYELLARGSRDIILFLDRVTGRILEANAAAETAYGYDRKELLARTIHDLRVDGRMAEQQMHEADVHGLLFETVHRRRDGSVFPVEVSSRGATLDGRRALISVIRDVAERKQSEAERLELHNQLLHSQKLESLGILAGGIAHDFNNMLTVILGQTNLVLERTPADSLMRSSLEAAVQSARRAADLTRQMLAYSGKGNFVIEQVDLGELVKGISHLLRSVVARTITMDVQLSPQLPSVHADRGQIQQVIMNLITNASEAIGDGPGTITLATSMEELGEGILRRNRTGRALEPGEFICLTVSDTGCGMDDMVMRQLFDPFFTTKFTGRGLGMSVVMGIVRGHGGVILVDSKPGSGTTLQIGFPVHASTATTGLAKTTCSVVLTADKAGPPASGTVLVVDDEEPVRNLCKLMIQSLGYDVLTARDGLEALEVFSKCADDISCVILDLSMPRMDGKKTLSQLRQLQPDVKVLLASGYGEMETAGYPPRQGPTGFLQKPFAFEDMEKALRAVLAQTQ